MLDVYQVYEISVSIGDRYEVHCVLQPQTPSKRCERCFTCRSPSTDGCPCHVTATPKFVGSTRSHCENTSCLRSSSECCTIDMIHPHQSLHAPFSHGNIYNHNNPPTRPIQASTKREGDVGPTGALPPDVSLATLCALLATGVGTVPVAGPLDAPDVAEAGSIDGAVDISVVEDTVNEAVTPLSDPLATLPVGSAASVLPTPVTLPAVSIARYVGNANPLPGGNCFVSEPEQQSWSGQCDVMVHSAVVGSPAGDSAHE